MPNHLRRAIRGLTSLAAAQRGRWRLVFNACCDYNTRIGKGAILANGSATRVGQVIPDNSFAEGIPAIVKKKNISDEDRLNYFGVLPSEWTRYEAGNIETRIRRKQDARQ